MQIQKILFILLMIITCSISAQAQQGIITYKAGTHLSRAEIQAKLDSMGNKKNTFQHMLFALDEAKKLEYELLFNKKQSLFQEKDLLNENRNILGYSIATILIASDIHYKNLTTKEKISQTEYSGEILNIKEDFQAYQWEITKEEKTIVGYKCYKATATYLVNIKGDEVERVLTVWFTKDIPVPFGPKGYDGLPGVVLQADWGNKFFLYASKVQLGKDLVKDKDIRLPKGGKDITRREWDDFMVKENVRIRSRN